MLNMEFINDRSCALDNFPATQMDMSELTDTLPSVSLDNDNLERGPLLKDHYNNIEKLRKENFDLKIKLYLYESNENIVENSEFKSRILNEFDRKNNEIRFLNESLQVKSKELNDIKKRINEESNGKLPQDIQIENKQLKSKLAKLLQLCSCLVNQTKCDELINKTLIEKISQFLSENSSLGSNIESLPFNGNESKLATLNGHNVDLIIPQDESNRDNLVAEFLKTMEKLRSLIEEFRVNKITYKSFLANLDSIFEILSKQQKLLEKSHLDQFNKDARIVSIERQLTDEIAMKERMKSEIKKRIQKLDKMILKTRDQL